MNKGLPEKRPRLAYVRGLDGLRGVAILMVMAYHFQVWYMPGGFLGVDLFFVLSGFLITSILLIEWRGTGAVSLRSFYWRRAVRLLPALLLLLIFVVLVFRDIGWAWPLLTLSYLSNWALAFGWVQVGPLSHVWSLSIEEQFYVIWPILLLALLKWCRSKWTIITITSSLALASATLKVVAWDEPSSWLRLYHGSDSRADALLIGCVLGMLVTWDLIPRRPPLLRVIQLLAIVSLGVLGYFASTASLDARVLYSSFGLSLVALSSTAVILSVIFAPIAPLQRLLEWSVLVKIGTISYGLYLWHHAVSFLPWDEAKYGFLPTFYVHTVLSFLGAFASYRYVERPAAKLRDRWQAERDEAHSGSDPKEPS